MAPPGDEHASSPAENAPHRMNGPDQKGDAMNMTGRIAAITLAVAGVTGVRSGQPGYGRNLPPGVKAQTPVVVFP